MAAVDLRRTAPAGVPSLQFRFFPIAGDEHTFLLVEAPLAAPPEAGEAPRIRTTIVLGERVLNGDITVVADAAPDAPLVLGQDCLGGWIIDPRESALAGLPAPTHRPG